LLLRRLGDPKADQREAGGNDGERCPDHCAHRCTLRHHTSYATHRSARHFRMIAADLAKPRMLQIWSMGWRLDIAQNVSVLFLK
jgi:hypothetical protein